MDDYENDAKYNLAETCCASISLDDLAAFSENPGSILDFSQKQVYGAIRGSNALRTNIANLYSDSTSESLTAENILVTNGAIQANFLSLYTNVGPGDHVICHYPTYQQLYSVPESFGAEVSLWKSKQEEDWRVDLDELKGLIRPNTKVIIIKYARPHNPPPNCTDKSNSNPQNPTGAVLNKEMLRSIVDIARQHGITIHSDEVYRPLFHSLDADDQLPPSIMSLGYDKVIVTGSMSKTFSLAGIRVGWIASRSRDIIERCASVRHYTTISVSQVDDQIATAALGTPTVINLLQRNIDLARRNLAEVDSFVREFWWAVKWTRPGSGTTAFMQFVDRAGRPIDDVDFCKGLQAKTGVMLVPGSQCFGGGSDFKGFVRMGYVQEHQVVVDGLQALRKFMRDDYERLVG